ncbi:MAG TPA: hypothetical protein VMR33_02350 [Candidatus Baltobacteraceae bacterium]|jgi:hypothetical protein|nr:hypothetical protein [Candidatus Baltobacteraceae bacterium]
MELTEQAGEIRTATGAGRAFDFYADTFSYRNELVWEYRFDPETRRASTRKNDPPPCYAHHCFVVVRSARQFYLHGAFLPDRQATDATGYREIIRSVTGRSAFRLSAPGDRIAIPGFANLRQFSAAHGDLLRENCGGAWQSYTQRGNWRMILPFTRRGQARMAGDIQEALASGRLPIIHVVTFPRLTINHVLLIFGVSTAGGGLEFHCYDPNICEKPLILVYDSAGRTFIFPRTHYFPGGKVNVYEIYRGWFL